MLCNTSVNTVITLNNGYFEERNFISKNNFVNLTKLYSQKINWFPFIRNNLFLSEVLTSSSTIFIFSHKNPSNNYLLKIDSRNTRKRCEICSKLTIKIPEQRQWRCSSVFLVNLEHISHSFSTAFVVNSEQVNVSWVKTISSRLLPVRI